MYGLHHTWERIWPIGNGSQLKAICSVDTILMNGPINNLLEFHFQGKPKTIAFHIIRHKWSSGNWKLTALLFSTRSFLCTRTTLYLEHWWVIRECIFYSDAVSVSLSPTAICLLQTSLLGHSREYRRCRFFLCVADMLSFATKQLFAFLPDLAAEQSHLICTNDFLIYENEN